MQREVVIHFGRSVEFVLPDAGSATPMASDQARRWLDEQFVANGCEPLRASGKVLIADKVLGDRKYGRPCALLSRTARGPMDYARAVLGALDRNTVHVDVDAGAVTF